MLYRSFVTGNSLWRNIIELCYISFHELILFLDFLNPKRRSRTWVKLLQSAIFRGKYRLRIIRKRPCS